MKTWFITTEERQALKRAIKLLELKPGTLFLACFLGAAGLGASIALGATAAWLIARASQMPPVLYLEVAVVSVRFFGISKAVFRYLERLASHQLGVSGMTTLRTNLYKTLSHSDTARIASLRRGDILDRMGTDVDNIGDFVVKSLLPAMVASHYRGDNYGSGDFSSGLACRPIFGSGAVAFGSGRPVIYYSFYPDCPAPRN